MGNQGPQLAMTATIVDELCCTAFSAFSVRPDNALDCWNMGGAVALASSALACKLGNISMMTLWQMTLLQKTLLHDL
jgi:hypothetical protein